MKPIRFKTDDEIRAILDGRKTVTRRVVKPQYGMDADGKEHTYAAPVKWGNVFLFPWADRPNIKAHYSPPYRPGDILYVLETWGCWKAHRYEADAYITYKAGGPQTVLKFPNGSSDSFKRDEYDEFTRKWFDYTCKWQPSIHMPREAARIFLRVTDVRVERLFDSFFRSGAIFDLRSEGITIPEVCANCIETYGYPCCTDEDEEGSECVNLDDVRYDFSLLWDSSIKPADRERYGWAASPWVWVIKFERCDKPEEG